ncbi:hypothetical protein N7456_000399 [Penicillium angulare]|uniref:FAD-binding PCMH-type domain-containing protein n=1 Tax=Penicillium angulare TaxID=116970 RepID=A0A9W9GC30_9EURO|nr:hypothetical protein N7456_000399 [Penicillium angulare]
MAGRIVLSLFATGFAYAAAALSPAHVNRDLRSFLSSSAVIDGYNATAYARWSNFDAPHPGVVISPGSEQDVATIVSYCTSNKIPFLTQSGAHGWANTFQLNESGILINIKSLDSVVFNANKTEVTVGGGVAISDVISAGSKAGALVQTGNCNCVGALGAILGGGYGNLLGLVGFGVDNLLSVNLVLANGTLANITPKDKDLWWALRGAGPNFGIVTSAKVKSYPVSSSGQTAWFGQLVYSGSKVEEVVQTIQNTTLKPKMSEGRAAFMAFLELGPSQDTTTELQYPHWNDGAASFCEKGGYKPSYSVGLANMHPTTWRQVWNEYVSWVSINGTGNSIILMEAYSLEKARSFAPSSSSFAWRNDVNFNAVVIPWYYDTRLGSKAQSWGRKVRNMWRETDDLAAPASYVNFAHGDETLHTVYGDNVSRLKKVKKEIDPNSVFNQWFEI